ncbi:MAG: DUF2203 family protein [Dehalococcoidia bacterium]|nr:MAG: DUF2203 family protein [Dehalococcoidia bacterium]
MPAGNFTLEEARTALRLIRHTVLDLQRTQVALRAVKDELNALNRRHLNNGVVGERRIRDLNREQRRLGEEAQRHIAAITGAGAEIKGIDEGLIDFPTTIHGVLAYWCWRAGEDDIDWWHPRTSGFSGRRPITEL